MTNRAKIQSLLAQLKTPQLAVLVARSALRALPFTCSEDAEDKLALWPSSDQRLAYLLYLFRGLATVVLSAESPSLAKNQQTAAIRDDLQTKAKRAVSDHVRRMANGGETLPSLRRAETALHCIVQALRAVINVRPYRFAAECIEAELALGLQWVDLELEVKTLQRATGSLSTLPLFGHDPEYGTSSRLKEAERLWFALRKGILDEYPEFDHWVQWFEQRLAAQLVDLEDEKKRVFIATELKARDAAEINAYLRRLREESHTLDRVRVIVLGWNFSGKSTLVQAIQGKPVRKGATAMTPGVSIDRWQIPGTNILAHLWDFGGQVIAHATHQFFLRERCLYIVVIDGRADQKPEEQAEYWLQHVRSFGANAPVMLVGNKADEMPLNIDGAGLIRKYPNITAIYTISALEYKGQYKKAFDTFTTDLIDNLKTISDNQVRLTANQFKVLRKLIGVSGTSSYITEPEYNEVCTEFSIPESGQLDRKWLLKLLDDLGVIVHFEKLDWAKSYILNPQWLTVGVYTIIYSDLLNHTGGVLSETQIAEILQTKKVIDAAGHELTYPPAMCKFIIEVMKHFQVCYELPGSPGSYIIPDRLPATRPSFHFDKSEAIQFRFNFSQLLPPHVFPMLVVQNNKDVRPGHVWQKGAWFSAGMYPATEALVEVEPVPRRISVSVVGAQRGIYFCGLHKEIAALINLMPGLEVEQEIALIPTAKADRSARPKGIEWTNFQALVNQNAHGSTDVASRTPGVYYDTEAVLKPIPRPERVSLSITIGSARSVVINTIQKNVERLADEARELVSEIDRIVKQSHGTDEETLVLLGELKRSLLGVEGKPLKEKKSTLEHINECVDQLETKDSSLYKLLFKLYRSDEIITKLGTRCNDLAHLIQSLF